MDAIVVGVDGSDGSKHALAWALEEARVRHATLRAVIAWHIPSAVSMAPGFPDTLPHDFETEASTRLASIVDDLGPDAQGVSIERRVVEGAAAPVLLREAEDARLLVVGSRGLGGFRELLLGSVGQHCAHHARCPVVIVRA